MSAFSEAEGNWNGELQKPQHHSGKRPWSSWRFYFLEDTSIIAMDRLE
jgi:hypothetical protein